MDKKRLDEMQKKFMGMKDTEIVKEIMGDERDNPRAKASLLAASLQTILAVAFDKDADDLMDRKDAIMAAYVKFMEELRSIVYSHMDEEGIESWINSLDQKEQKH